MRIPSSWLVCIRPCSPGVFPATLRRSGKARQFPAGANCKPVFVPLRAIAIRLGRALLRGSSNLPGSLTERAAPSPLFGLAPRGVCPASRITPSAVRSYRTFSPLPNSLAAAWRYVFCGTFRKDPFERSPPAVSRHVALWRPDFPPACASGYPSSPAMFRIACREFPVGCVYGYPDADHRGRL